MEYMTRYAGIPIEGGTVRQSDHPDRSGGDGSRRVCNLHGPMWYSWKYPKYAPCDETRTHDREVGVAQSNQSYR